ncbi:MHYT domain-containing protein [Plantactinospora soyae]|uniref:NO-binding membrane sensor protein with MHYT domain n=1 Tax=Plantactinospora soyae TaxID=1544732 RepID=A0A927M997_9ACTN|nr:MHYT domain-containing protein [Plantactinospora soyae]MBE1490357.1 NO-binding membrane sensor protein with MHYT domain [Plantactinospora soyae]
MATIDHFQYGWITPVLSFGLSVLGSFLGLLCAARAREAQAWGRRAWWLGLAAWAIGGTAIWTMHFTAMLGFRVAGTQIRYDVPVTVLSAVIAVAVVGIGLFIVGFGRVSWPRLVLGGMFAGLGVAGMHYLGMGAMRMRGRVDYTPSLVAASVLIAVVAATAAFWLAVNVRGSRAVTGAAVVMGFAVSGMHYTGMAAMGVHAQPTGPAPAGANGSTLLLPIMLIVIFVAFVLFYALLASPTEDDRAASAYLADRAAERAAADRVAADRAAAQTTSDWATGRSAGRAGPPPARRGRRSS